MRASLFSAIGSFALSVAVLSGSQKPLVGELKDPVGDVKPNRQMPTPPDLVHARFEVSNGALTITASFAPGTLSPQTTVNIYLDTDEDAKTGTVVFIREKNQIGADFEIQPLQPQNVARAALTAHPSATESKLLGLIDVVSPSIDQRRFVVPLQRLGNDDGRMAFKLECSFIVNATDTGSTSKQTIMSHVDVMPNINGRPGLVR